MIECDVMTFWDGTFKREVIRDYKMSLCTCCMNRMQDIRRTLPANIKAERGYENVEFVLLDYNSSDGLGEWVRSEMMKHIQSGKLVYYRTEEPKYYDFSHAKNVAFRLASGDIVCNLDADNFTFTKIERFKSDVCWSMYMNRLANESQSKIILARGKRVNHGRVGFYKSDFVDLLGGYDERMSHYGYEDYDITRRAWHLGFVMYWWGTAYFNRYFTHMKDRIVNLDMSDYESEYEMQAHMKSISDENIAKKRYKVNEGIPWGYATVTKNFKEIEI